MSVLVLAENPKGNFKKATFEAVHFGYKTAQALGTDCVALVLGDCNDAGTLGEYGANKVIHIADSKLNNLDTKVFSDVITQVADKTGATIVLVNHSSTGKSLLGGLAAKLNAGAISGVNALPTQEGGKLRAKKAVFAGKAISEVEVNSEKAVLSLMGNSLPPETVGSAVPAETMDVNIPESTIKVVEQKTVDGTVPLPEAELVVSAGRGMKGPENWGIIDELADTLGATTACSRPVADTGWRPHHEHVGQTGIAIRPNLYIAIGISGAIQHLAGVNNSKTIVVINKDPEAPFFKAADYGICADLFDVVPALTASLKKHKENN